MVKIKTALLSVSDKTGIPEFARRLRELGVDVILSTSGTARLLHEYGIEVQKVYEHENFPEILNALIRTIARRANGDDSVADSGVPCLDMVVSNLYAAGPLVARPGMELVSSADEINIDGPTLIRAAAKNYSHVVIVTDPARYDAVADEMRANDGGLTSETRFHLARLAFRHTAHYDTSIARCMAGLVDRQERGPERLTIEFVRKRELRCGDNPHQTAVFYVEENAREPGIAAAEQIAGPAPSYVDMVCADAGIRLAREFDLPAAVAFQHGNLSAAAAGERLEDAVAKAVRLCPVGQGSCTLVLNRPLDPQTAGIIAGARCGADPDARPCCPAAVVAPGFEDKALSILRQAVLEPDGMGLLATGPFDRRTVNERAREGLRVVGGLLVQSRDLTGFEPAEVKTVTRVAPGDAQLADLSFAWLCCKHARSCAAVLARDRTLVGIARAQTGPASAAAAALAGAGERARGSVMAFDGPLESREPIEGAAAAGVRAIIQPGGSPQDPVVVAAADRAGIAMVLTGIRHLRH